MTRLDDSVTAEFADFRTFDLRTILRRFLWKKRQEKKTTFDSCYNHNDRKWKLESRRGAKWKNTTFILTENAKKTARLFSDKKHDFLPPFWNLEQKKRNFIGGLLNVNNSNFKTIILRISERNRKNRRLFSRFDWRTERKNRNENVISALRQLETNIRLLEFNVKVLRNINHDRKNLRIVINFTTSFHFDKKETENNSWSCDKLTFSGN